MCDKDLLRLLADQRGRTVTEMASPFSSYPNSDPPRLHRLMAEQAVTRKRSDDARGKRGRPKYLYYITSQGRQHSGGGRWPKLAAPGSGTARLPWHAGLRRVFYGSGLPH